MTSKENILALLRSKKNEFSNCGVEVIGLFGSYAKNQQSNKSDIDLLIDFAPGKETFDNFMAACNIIEKLFNDIKVEVVTKNGLSKYIGPKILKEVVYV